MSLKIWLPLNRDLRNQGVIESTIVGNSVTFNTSGKLGGCYSFTGSPSKITNTLTTPISNSIGSLCCWVKFNAMPSSTYWYSLLHLGNIGGFAACRLGLYMEYANTINVSVNGSGKGVNTYTHSLVTDTWYHICATYDGTLIKLYIDGNEVMSKVATLGTYTTDASKLYIGGTNNYYLNGYVNDARYYDHALSVSEVKILSQGLVAHYQLNGYGSQENLFSWQNKGNQVIPLNTYQNVGSFLQFNNCLTFDPSTTVGTKYTISLWARSPNGPTKLSIYNSNSSPRWFYFSTVLTTSLGSEWEYFTYTFTNSDRGSGNETENIVRRIEIYMPSQTGGEVKDIKIEVGETATRWSPGSTDSMYSKLGYDSTTVYDSSGYNYHCTSTGTLIVNADTPRNTLSVYFDGTAQITRESITSEVKSVSFWIKTPKTASTCAFADYKSQLGFGFNSSKKVITSSAGRKTYFHPSTDITENVWHHIAIVKTSATNTDNLYVDGVLQSLDTSATDVWNHTSDIFSMTGRSYTSAFKMNCYISDFRMYATSLSADDVKELYQVSAKIDDHGNMYGYEINENITTRARITKQGIINASKPSTAFIEDSGSSVLDNQFVATQFEEI